MFPVSPYGADLRLWFKEDLGLVVVTKVILPGISVSLGGLIMLRSLLPRQPAVFWLVIGLSVY